MAVVELTKDNFEQTIKDHDFIIVDFWAPWRGPARSFAPIHVQLPAHQHDILLPNVNTADER